MATRAQKTVALLIRCWEQADDLKLRRPQDIYTEQQMMGRYMVLKEVARSLKHIVSKTEPAIVHELIERLLERLTEKKANRMIDEIRKRPSSRQLPTQGETEGAIAQIDVLMSELWDLLSPQWKRTDKRHGRYFHLYHWVGDEALSMCRKAFGGGAP